MGIVDTRSLQEPVVGTCQALLDRRRTDGEQNFVVLRVLELLCSEYEQSVPRNNVSSIKLVMYPLYIFLKQLQI